MKILAIAGSLRNLSKNTTLLRAAISLAPPTVEVTLYGGLGELPFFTPDLDDLDHGEAPATVLDLRAQLRASDGVLICSPEYAHGVSGVMKNALDWLVGSGEFEKKPTVLLNASVMSTHAQAALAETLRTMGALLTETTLTRSLAGAHVTVDEVVANPGAADVLREALASLARAVETLPTAEASKACHPMRGPTNDEAKFEL